MEMEEAGSPMGREPEESPEDPVGNKVLPQRPRFLKETRSSPHDVSRSLWLQERLYLERMEV